MKAALDTIQQFRKLKKDAEALAVDPVLVDNLTALGKQTMAADLEEIQAEVMQHCHMNDMGRVNELKTAIKFSINGVANRMERGFLFEVRTVLPLDPDQATIDQAKTVQALTQVRFTPAEGPPMLALPEVEAAAAAKEEPTKKAAKKK